MSSIIQHHPTLQNMFYETVLDDVLQWCFTHLDRPELTCTPPLLKLHQLKGPIWFHVVPQFMLCESRELLLLQDISPHLPPPPLLWTHQNLFPQFVLSSELITLNVKGGAWHSFKICLTSSRVSSVPSTQHLIIIVRESSLVGKECKPC